MDKLEAGQKLVVPDMTQLQWQEAHSSGRSHAAAALVHATAVGDVPGSRLVAVKVRGAAQKQGGVAFIEGRGDEGGERTGPRPSSSSRIRASGHAHAVGNTLESHLLAVNSGGQHKDRRRGKAGLAAPCAACLCPTPLPLSLLFAPPFHPLLLRCSTPQP